MIETIKSVSVGELPVMESFYSIQGEGFHAGKAAYFIRLAGCDVGCSWCDVKESWDTSHHPIKKVDELVTLAVQSISRIAIITGGEPLMHNLDLLTRRLMKNGFLTHIETSGAYDFSGTWNWICVSPKKFKKPTDEALERADELKVVVYNKHDLIWAEQMASKVSPQCKLFLQPEWGKSSAMMPEIISYVKDHPQWGVSLQIHKYMDIP